MYNSVAPFLLSIANRVLSEYSRCRILEGTDFENDPLQLLGSGFKELHHTFAENGLAMQACFYQKSKRVLWE